MMYFTQLCLQDLQMLEIDTEFDKFCSQITDNQLSEIITPPTKVTLKYFV